MDNNATTEPRPVALIQQGAISTYPLLRLLGDPARDRPRARVEPARHHRGRRRGSRATWCPVLARGDWQGAARGRAQASRVSRAPRVRRPHRGRAGRADARARARRRPSATSRRSRAPARTSGCSAPSARRRRSSACSAPCWASSAPSTPSRSPAPAASPSSPPASRRRSSPPRSASRSASSRSSSTTTSSRAWSASTPRCASAAAACSKPSAPAGGVAWRSVTRVAHARHHGGDQRHAADRRLPRPPDHLHDHHLGHDEAARTSTCRSRTPRSRSRRASWSP